MYEDDELYEDDKCDFCGTPLEGHHICRACHFHHGYDEFLDQLFAEGIDDDFNIWWIEED
jgi:hypothetical protein